MKRKGFTLIELLAVIVILAIIALIATPMILSVIESVNKEAFKDSAYGMVKAAELYYANHLKEDSNHYLFEYENGKPKEGSLELGIKGEVPEAGKIEINAKGQTQLEIKNSKYLGCKTYSMNSVQVYLIEEMGSCGIDEEGNISIGGKGNNYPVGSIYISVNEENPSKILGGEWEQFGEGKTLVGVDNSQEEFNSIEKTGGEKNHTLTIDEIPTHSHEISSLSGTTSTVGNHSHEIWPTFYGGSGWPTQSISSQYAFSLTKSVQNSNYAPLTGPMASARAGTTSPSGTHNHTVTTDPSQTETVGNSKPYNNLQPYITVYMWKRIS